MHFACLLEILLPAEGPFKVFKDRGEIDPVVLDLVNTKQEEHSRLLLL